VDPIGNVKLMVRTRGGPSSSYPYYAAGGTVVKGLAMSYAGLKKHFDDRGVTYTPDNDFERDVTEAARLVSG